MSIYQATDIFWGQQENISLQNGIKGGETYLASEQMTASYIKTKYLDICKKCLANGSPRLTGMIVKVAVEVR